MKILIPILLVVLACIVYAQYSHHRDTARWDKGYQEQLQKMVRRP